MPNLIAKQKQSYIKQVKREIASKRTSPSAKNSFQKILNDLEKIDDSGPVDKISVQFSESLEKLRQIYWKQI